MINLKSISNMYDEEINEDIKLKEELLNELKDFDLSYKTKSDMSTLELLDYYKTLRIIGKI